MSVNILKYIYKRFPRKLKYPKDEQGLKDEKLLAKILYAKTLEKENPNYDITLVLNYDITKVKYIETIQQREDIVNEHMITRHNFC